MADTPQKVWPHRGLTDVVVTGAHRTGIPEHVPYEYRPADDDGRAEAIEARLAAYRRARCPGSACGRLRDGGCQVPCAVQGQGLPPPGDPLP
jgi:hypothetical protein